MEDKRREEEIDLLELFFVLLRKWWILGISTVACAAVSLVITVFCITPMYSATSKLYILSQSTSITSLADIQVGTSLTKDYVQLVQSRPVVEEVINNLNLNRKYDELLKQITITNPSDSRILVIKATDPDPVLAKDIVDQFAEVSQRSISSVMKTAEPSIVEFGYADGDRVSPSYSKNTVLGGFIGFIIAAGIIIVIHLLDDSVTTSDDVEKYLKLNVLAAIPMKEDEKKSVKLALPKKGGKK